jgi:hypothetical protein|tara:strand:- start:101 stop:451 length:351 start_codon:yes stop_codon:yes gene_type:complete|mmetsp:Transcript_467/g.1269  ORF Transcript_467/g.1269 Transcript_467/m.1269 type:complete len:117 (+) Transcript_467:1642-1992(+)
MNFKASFALETDASLHTNFDFFATRVASWYGFFVSIRILFADVDDDALTTTAGDDDDDDETRRAVVLALNDGRKQQHPRHNDARLYPRNIEMNFDDFLESQEQKRVKSVHHTRDDV